MITLQSIDFTPPGTLTLQVVTTVAARGFNSSRSLSLGSLPPSDQAAAGAALGWLAAQLGEGFELESITLEKRDAPATSEESAPSSATIVAAVLGKSAAGSTNIPQGELVPPPEVATTLLALWDTIAGSLTV